MYSIYKIINTFNNKIYIGQTIKPVEIRFQEHIKESKRSNLKYKLHRAIKNTEKIYFILKQFKFAKIKQMLMN